MWRTDGEIGTIRRGRKEGMCAIAFVNVCACVRMKTTRLRAAAADAVSIVLLSFICFDKTFMLCVGGARNRESAVVATVLEAQTEEKKAAPRRRNAPMPMRVHTAGQEETGRSDAHRAGHEGALLGVHFPSQLVRCLKAVRSTRRYSL